MPSDPPPRIPVVLPADTTAAYPVARPVEDDDPPPRRRSRRRDDDDDDDDRRPPKRKKPPPATGFLISVGFFAALVWSMIAYMVVVGVYVAVRYSDYDTIPRHVLKDRAVTDGFVLGGLHAVLVGVAIAVTWRPKPLPDRGEPVVTWVAALPVLAAMLLVNFGYGLALRFLVEVGLGVKPEAGGDDDVLLLGAGWIGVLLICVQPAVVEELFFRFLMLGHLRPHVGLHGAVWVSSFFFAAAHIGQLIAFPVLLLLGAVMGYARVYSGGLVLPMVLHFLHNLAVLTAGPYLDQFKFW